MMRRLRLWTDGCCLGLNRAGQPSVGVGGWAFVAEYGGQIIHEANGGTAETRAMRMELAAVIEALVFVTGREAVEVVSDCKHVVEGLEGKLHEWKAQGWQRAYCARLGHVGLWKQIDRLLRDRDGIVSVSWIKGHAGHAFNTRADQLAREAARDARAIRARRSSQRPGTTVTAPALSG